MPSITAWTRLLALLLCLAGTGLAAALTPEEATRVGGDLDRLTGGLSWIDQQLARDTDIGKARKNVKRVGQEMLQGTEFARDGIEFAAGVITVQPVGGAVALPVATAAR